MSGGEKMTFHFEGTADDFADAIMILTHGGCVERVSTDTPAQEELSEPAISDEEANQKALQMSN